MHACMCVCMHLCVYVCVSMHLCVYVCVSMHLCVYVCVCVCVCVCSTEYFLRERLVTSCGCAVNDLRQQLSNHFTTKGVLWM